MSATIPQSMLGNPKSSTLRVLPAGTPLQPTAASGSRPYLHIWVHSDADRDHSRLTPNELVPVELQPKPLQLPFLILHSSIPEPTLGNSLHYFRLTADSLAAAVLTVLLCMCCITINNTTPEQSITDLARVQVSHDVSV